MYFITFRPTLFPLCGRLRVVPRNLLRQLLFVLHSKIVEASPLLPAAATRFRLLAVINNNLPKNINYLFMQNLLSN